jgi:hypothetical protein
MDFRRSKVALQLQKDTVHNFRVRCILACFDSGESAITFIKYRKYRWGYQSQNFSHSFARLNSGLETPHNKSFCGMWTNRSHISPWALIPAAPSPTIVCRLNEEEEEKRAQNWITAITEGTSECTVPDDYGLHSMPSIMEPTKQQP